MIELEDWQARPSAPPALALLKELLAGSGPRSTASAANSTSTKTKPIAGWIGGGPGPTNECGASRRSRGTIRAIDPDAHNKLFNLAMKDFRTGLREYNRYAEPSTKEPVT